MKKIKILVIYSECDLVTRKMLEALSQDQAFEVVFAATSDYDNLPGCRCRNVEMLPIKSKFSPSAISSLRNVLKRENPDVVYSISSKALSTALFASWGMKGIKNVGYRGTQAKVRRSDPTYYLGVLNPRVDHIVCETPDIETYLQDFISKDKLSIACKPFELSWVKEAMDSPYDLDERGYGRLQLVNIGSSKGRPHKGMSFMVKAMNLLRDLPVHLTVVGDVDDADMENAPENITFQGYRNDAMKFLPKADILVLPSTRDASPRVVREAQACGVPCIVSDIPGARDLIVDGVTGLLVTPGSPKAIADAVKSLEGDKERLNGMRIAARNLIADKFRMDSYVDYFKNLFFSLSSPEI